MKKRLTQKFLPLLLSGVLVFSSSGLSYAEVLSSGDETQEEYSAQGYSDDQQEDSLGDGLFDNMEQDYPQDEGIVLDEGIYDNSSSGEGEVNTGYENVMTETPEGDVPAWQDPVQEGVPVGDLLTTGEPQQNAEEQSQGFSSLSSGGTDELLSSDTPEAGDLLAGTEAAKNDLLSGSIPAGTEEEGLDYIKGRKLTEEEKAEQLSYFRYLTPIDPGPRIEIEEYNDPNDVLMGNALPGRYNAADQGYVTSVKDQNPYGNCWAYTMASLMETSLLRKGLGTYDLSESHLSYYMYNRVNDPLGNTEGDKNIPIGGDYLSIGGNPWMSGMNLASWSGMAYDSYYPKNYTSFNGTTAEGYNTVAYLQDAVFSNYSVDRVKQLIYNYGYQSVGCLIYMTENSSYYKPDTAALCSKNLNQVNHVVTIVGWDDNYSKANFAKGSKVNGNGAWIVKNSWGAGFGKNGYFYISYEDTSIQDIVAVTATINPTYRNNYFYDGSLALVTTSMEPGDSVACIYKTKAGGFAEALREIVLMTNGTESNTFIVEVYLGLTSLRDPTSGTRAYLSKAYTQRFSGVTTLNLGKTLEIPGNTYYSIILTNAGSKSIRFGLDYSIQYSFMRCVAQTSPGQGFMFSYNRWNDLGQEGLGGNLCSPRIKAHTQTLDYRPTISIDKTSATVTAGNKLQLNLSYSPASYGELGFTWVSSNTDAATVNGSGLVTAVNPGKTVISSWSKKDPSKKVECTLTVVPSAPLNLKGSCSGYKIRLSWSRSPGCDGYAVYAVNEDSTATLIGYRSGGANTAFIDPDNAASARSLKPGAVYRYAVRAYKDISGTRYLSSYSTVISVKLVLDKIRTTVRTSNTVRNGLTWNTVAGAQGYSIYRRIEGGAWVKIATATKQSVNRYTDKRVKAFQKYQYMVRGIRNTDSGVYEGPYKVSGAVVTSAPKQQVSLVRKSNGVQIKWKKQKQGNGYRIYRKTGNGKYKVLATVSDPNRMSFTDKSAIKGVTYTYQVQTIVKEFYGICYSKSNAVRIRY